MVPLVPLLPTVVMTPATLLLDAPVLTLKPDLSSVALPLCDIDEDETPAIAEKAFGKGRVLATSIPVDRDWTNWPDDPSYLIVMNRLRSEIVK